MESSDRATEVVEEDDDFLGSGDEELLGEWSIIISSFYTLSTES